MLNPKPNNVTKGSNTRDSLQLGIELKSISSHTQSYVHNKLLLIHSLSMDQSPWYSFLYLQMDWGDIRHYSVYAAHYKMKVLISLTTIFGATMPGVAQLSIVLAGITVFRTWFGSAKPFLRRFIWELLSHY